MDGFGEKATIDRLLKKTFEANFKAIENTMQDYIKSKSDTKI